jgi:hypothetical protein
LPPADASGAKQNPRRREPFEATSSHHDSRPGTALLLIDVINDLATQIAFQKAAEKRERTRR